jgi:small subunit ribosomal protein S2
MGPYIFGKRNLIHIIDLKETIKGLIRASNFLYKITSVGQETLFVGTKRQARNVVQREVERCEMHYVCDRWLGGTLTNHATILGRLKRLEELEAMEQDGTLQLYSKKMISSLMREKRKLTRNLGGIRRMQKLPGAIVIVDIKRELIAVKEANKLGIPTIGLIDTDSDPTLLDIPIPGNDDAFRSIQVILSRLVDMILKGKTAFRASRAELQKAGEEKAAEGVTSRETSEKPKGKARVREKAGAKTRAKPRERAKSKEKEAAKEGGDAAKTTKTAKTDAVES